MAADEILGTHWHCFRPELGRLNHSQRYRFSSGSTEGTLGPEVAQFPLLPYDSLRLKPEGAQV